ncbi:MAG TPA: glycosyltransferase [Solirubrobacteraceae bacterium]|nr:glycosyltransferase [Solirubrobacteraceae bacterium]
MPRLKHMQVGAIDPHRFGSVLSDRDYRELLELIDRAVDVLRSRVIWNVNSTYRGGGVAELLRSLLGYARGGGVDARWVVIRGEPAFFTTTKRLHNYLHGFDDGGELRETDRLTYEQTLAANAADLVPLLRPNDVVILHDPQTAGLTDAVKRTGATVIWRCHVGLDRPNERSRTAWAFLRTYLGDADAYVFSRATFAWEGLDRDRIAVITPSIDAFSPKNQEQAPCQSRAILTRAGILAADRPGQATFTRADGTPGRVDRGAEVVQASRLRGDTPLVVQVSRWDRLKDPIGVMEAFAHHIAGSTPADLVLAGPAADAVVDDPEGASVFAETVRAWEQLTNGVRPRVHLAALPMIDAEENAAIVNALQRHADVVVQKSLAEGFGLTVAEAMWKQRPVVASRIGGIQDQIVDGESGVLIDDPRDLARVGAAVVELLSDPDHARQIGAAARRRVADRFLAPRHLARYFQLIERLASR